MKETAFALQTAKPSWGSDDHVKLRFLLHKKMEKLSSLILSCVTYRHSNKLRFLFYSVEIKQSFPNQGKESQQLLTV